MPRDSRCARSARAAFGARWDRVAWHPYPVSLRLANLCFAAGHLGGFDALAPGALKVGVMVAEEDVGRAADVLRKQFEALLKKEGSGALVAEAIDLSQSEITCPACGHKGALVDGACADCGLFLGAPDGA